MMYTITRGPSKLVTQRRTGPKQQIENRINDLKHKQTHWPAANFPTPKLVFNRLNGKRYHTPPAPQVDRQTEGFTAAHEENVKFVYEAWLEVEQQLGPEGGSESHQEQEHEPAQNGHREEEHEPTQNGHREEEHEPAQNGHREPECRPVQYSEKSPSAAMKNFVPIDLDEWWAQRFLANIDNLS